MNHLGTTVNKQQTFGLEQLIRRGEEIIVLGYPGDRLEMSDDDRKGVASIVKRRGKIRQA